MKTIRHTKRVLSFLLTFALLTGIFPATLTGLVSYAAESDEWEPELIEIPAHGKMYSELSRERKDELIEAFRTSDEVFEELETQGICITVSVGHINMANQHNLSVDALAAGAILHGCIDSLARELHRLGNLARTSKNMDEEDVDGIQELILRGNQLPAAMELYAEANDLSLEFLYEQNECDGGTEHSIIPLNTYDYNPLNLIAAPFSYSASENSRVNMNTGEYTHEEVDLLLPGKNGLDLEIRRRFDSSIPVRNPISWGDDSTAIIYDLTYAFYYSVGSASDDLGLQTLESMRILPDQYHLYNWTHNWELRDFRVTYRASQRELAVAVRNSLNRGTARLNYQNGQSNSVLFRPVITVREGNLWNEANNHGIVSGTLQNPYSDPHGLGHGWSYAFSRIETYWTAVVNGRSIVEDYIRLSDGRMFKIDTSNTPSRLAGYKLRDLVFSRSGNTSTLTYGDGKVESFDNNGRLTQIRDRFGNTITFSYTIVSGRITRTVITDTLGRIVTLEQGANANQRVLIAPDNSRKTFNTRITRIGTDDIRFLDTAVDQNGDTTTYQSRASTVYFNPFFSDWIDVHGGFAQTTHRVILDRVTFPGGMQIRYETMFRSRILDGVGYLEYPALFRRYSVVSQQGETVFTDAEEFAFIGYYCGFGAESLDYNDNRFISERREVFLYSTPNGFISHPKSVQSHLFNHNQLTRRTDTRLSNQELLYPTTHDAATFNALRNNMNWRTIQSISYTYDRVRDLPSIIREENRCYLNPSSSPMIREHRYTYDDWGNVTRYTDPDGRVTDYIYFTGTGHFNLPRETTYRRDGSTIVRTVNTLTPGNNRTIGSTEIREGSSVTTLSPRQRTEFVYDNFGNVTRQTQFSTLSGNAFSNPVVTNFSYDDNQGRTGFNGAYLTETRADNITTKSSYDIMGRAQTTTDANGYVTSYRYDDLGNVDRITNPDNSCTTYERDYIANKLTVTDELGSVIEYTYLQNGALARVRDVVGNQVLSTYVYDLGMRLREETAHLSPTDTRRTVYRWDTQDRLLGERVYGAGGAILSDETYAYHDTHTNGQLRRVQKTVHGDGNAPSVVTTSYTNNMGFEARTGFFYNGTEHLNTFTHDYLGNVTQMLTALDAQRGRAFTMRYQYDHAGNVTGETNALNQTIIRGYDAIGRNTSVTDHAGNTTAFEYDSLDRLISQSVPFEGAHFAVTRYFYDPVGNLILEGTQNNRPGEAEAWARTEYIYNNRNFLTDVLSFDGNTVASHVVYTHDTAGNVLTMRTGTAADNYTTITYEYDRFGNVETITDALGQTETFINNFIGLVTEMTDRNGVVTTFTHDGLGRPLTVTAGGDTIIYEYTLTGQIHSQSQGNFTQTNTYDELGRLREQTEGGIVKYYDYDLAGNRTGYTVNGVTTTYEYDALNRLEKVFENGVLQAVYTYDANGNRESLTLANGVTTTYTYNLANLVTSVTNGTLSSYEYTYYLDGNQRTKTDHNNRTTTYEYDGLGRLTRETDDELDISYTFDARGNRATMTKNGVVTSYEYDLNNRLLGESYDNNGNQLTDGGIAYTYDTFNRMISAGNTTYIYRPDGLRHSKTNNNQTTTHVWDGSNISLDITGSNTVKYIRGIGLIATDCGIFYLFDGGGSVVGLTDASGTLTREYDYDAFGNERIQVIRYGDVDGDGVIDAADVALLRAFIAAVCRDEFVDRIHWFNIRNADVNGDGVIDDADVLLLRQYLASSNKANFHLGPPLSEDGNPWRYRGEYLDFESGNYYLRARYFAPQLGKFTQEDPWWRMQAITQHDPQGLNLYVYCVNNPVRWIDPSGLIIQLAGSSNEQRFMRDILGQLTNHSLGIDRNGQIFIATRATQTSVRNAGGSWLGVGNQLIENLISHNLTTTLQFGDRNTASASCWASSRDGTGSNTTVTLNRDSNIHALVNDGGRSYFERVPIHMILGHELVHAHNNANGVSLEWDWVSHTYRNTNRMFNRFTTNTRNLQDELFTIGISFTNNAGVLVNAASRLFTENALRREHGLPLRVRHY
jgi:RHS repeat-associated protein